MSSEFLPFALSLSKGFSAFPVSGRTKALGFDKLSPNGR
jgi:hypothetical protein